jgi:hypothetical protein
VNGAVDGAVDGAAVGKVAFVQPTEEPSKPMTLLQQLSHKFLMAAGDLKS